MRILLSAALVLFVSACAPTPEDEFFARLSEACGAAYAGLVVSDDPQDADWASQPVILHVTECSEDEIRMPLQVGDDTSRTLIVSRREDGRLELRHQHLHEDGSPDVLSMYGGISDREYQSAGRQNFPASDDTKVLFDAQGISVSNANVWAIEARPGFNMIAYEMSRPQRFFRVEFDTSLIVNQDQ